MVLYKYGMVWYDEKKYLFGLLGAHSNTHTKAGTQQQRTSEGEHRQTLRLISSAEEETRHRWGTNTSETHKVITGGPAQEDRIQGISQ